MRVSCIPHFPYFTPAITIPVLQYISATILITKISPCNTGQCEWGRCSNIVKRLGTGPGIVDWDCGLGYVEWGIGKREMGKWEIECTPVQGDDSIISQATHHIPTWLLTHHISTAHPTTFNNEGAAWQKSAFSKNVLGWSSWPTQHKKLPGGQRE